MAIRVRNLDLNANKVKGMYKTTVSLGDITATKELGIFVAPFDCTIDKIDIYSGQAVGGVSDSTIMTIRAQNIASSATFMVSRGTSASDSAHSNTIVANTAYTLIPTSGNFLTQGAAVELVFSAIVSAVLSSVICVTSYTPLVHRGVR